MTRFFLLPVAALVAAAPAWAQDVANVDNETLAALMAKGVPVVDIRTPPEWKQTGVLAGSHRIMAFDENGRLAPDFVQRLSQVAGPDDEVALICRTGNRTRALSQALARQLGYRKLYNVEKGIKAWMAEGRPVEK
ncbi:MAG: rhodanese-like domain-containing protein [Pseudomonadota bacterium]